MKTRIRKGKKDPYGVLGSSGGYLLSHLPGRKLK